MTDAMPIFINSIILFLTGANLDNQSENCLEKPENQFN